jgi:hypothetical protein
MIFWAITNYAGMYGQLDRHIGLFENMAASGPHLATAELSPQIKQNLALGVASFVLQEAKILNLEHTVQMAQQLDMQLKANRRFSPELIAQELNKLKQLIVMESSKRKLAFIAPPNDEFLLVERLFGESVHQAFPSARPEITDAGNALAADLGTATVFHLMRVAERGMRMLAWDRRVSVVRNRPLELQQWKDILDGIQSEVDAITNWPNRLGLAKTQAEEFYNGALAEFRGFKDAWRNHAMHDRRSYNFDEAKGVMTHVKRFMQGLSMRLSESSRTPKVWGKGQVIDVRILGRRIRPTEVPQPPFETKFTHWN